MHQKSHGMPAHALRHTLLLAARACGAQVQSGTKADKARAIRERCQSTLGPALFPVVYDYLRRVRGAPAASVDEKDVQRRLLDLVGGDKSALQGCFVVDQLVFQELMFA